MIGRIDGINIKVILLKFNNDVNVFWYELV